jgi:hypothetical protein
MTRGISISAARQTEREAVEHSLIRGLAGLPEMKPQPVEKTAAMLVRGMEQRSQTIVVPLARLALLTADLFQLAVERMARRHRWADAIQKREQAGEGRMVESGSPAS